MRHTGGSSKAPGFDIGSPLEYGCYVVLGLLAVSLGAQTTEIVKALAAARYGALPVVDDDGAYIGAVSAAETDDTAGTGAPDTAAERAKELPVLDPQQTLNDVLKLLHDHEATGLPVVAESGHLLGWIDHRDVLMAYSSSTRT